MCCQSASHRLLLCLCSILSLFSISATAQDSVADAARKNRPKDAQPAPKKVWTNDDLPSVSVKSSEALSNVPVGPDSDSEILRQFRLLSKEELAAAILKRAGAPDVDFPERKRGFSKQSKRGWTSWRGWKVIKTQAKQRWRRKFDMRREHSEFLTVSLEKVFYKPEQPKIPP